MTDRMPHSTKAEQALVGILLSDNLAIERIPDFFRSSHFHDPVLGKICEAILSAVHGGRSADPITVMERFQGDQAFEEVGGFEYLADLVEHAPGASNTADFCHVISDYAIRRELVRISDELVNGVHRDRETPALEMVDQLERQLYELSTFRPENGPKAFADVLSSTIEMAAAAYSRDGGLAGLSTGLMDLDAKIGGLRPENLIILAARPSMGKTALATNIGFDTARAYVPKRLDDGSIGAERGGVVALFSLEMSAEEIGLRILADAAGINSDRITKGEIDALEFSRMRDAAIEIRDAPLHIDATGGISLASIATRARRLKRLHGLHLIIIDYLQLVTLGSEGTGMKTQEVVSKVTQGLKALAKELKVPIIALSQLTRKVEERPDKKPLLADLRDSGSIEQDADTVLFVYRHAYYLEREQPKEGSEAHMKWEEELDACRHQAEVIVGKHRHGPVGTVKLMFKGETTKFSDTPRDETT